jgi:tetratricopeptide repeat protein 8
VEHNVKKCLELAVYATEANGYADPWWKLALGKCYYHLGFWQEGERQLLSSSVGHNHSVQAFLYLSKIYEKQDNVQRAVAILEEAKKTHAFEPKLDIAIGRIYDQLHDLDRSHECYKRVLAMENCNIEAVANMAAYYFYREQPEIALKLYQRLIELGYESP